jgi:glycyl-tRNA synthetase beta subunit
MTRDLEQEFAIDSRLLVEPEEKALFESLQKAHKNLENEPGFENALAQIEQLVPVINGFFDKVLVMVDDEALRNTRLGMLQTVAGLLKPFADISRLEGF